VKNTSWLVIKNSALDFLVKSVKKEYLDHAFARFMKRLDSWITRKKELVHFNHGWPRDPEKADPFRACFYCKIVLYLPVIFSCSDL